MDQRTRILTILSSYLAQMKEAHAHKDDRDWYYEDSPMIHRVKKAQKNTLLTVVEIIYGETYKDELLEEAMQTLDKQDRGWYS